MVTTVGLMACGASVPTVAGSAAETSAAAAAAKTALRGTVGVNALYVYNSEHDAQAGLITLAKGGIGWDRENFSWANLEPRQGTRDWSETDNLMTAASKAGTNILALLGDGAPWASSDPNPSDRCQSTSPAGDCYKYPPADTHLFAGFAASVVDRYGPGGSFWTAHRMLRPDPVTAIEVWNEPSQYRSWRPAPSPSGYARLFVDTANAVHDANRSMPVLMAGDLDQLTTTQGQNVPWLSSVLAEIKADGSDPGALAQGLSVHPYPDPSNLSPTDTSQDPRYEYARVELIRQAEQSAGYSIPLWITEIGWYTCDHGRSCSQAVSSQVQGGYLTRAIQIARTKWSAYVTHVFVYAYDSGNLSPDNYDIKATRAWRCVTRLLSSGRDTC